MIQAPAPACQRTPAASYIVMTVKQSATAKSELPRPNSSATAVVTACDRTQLSCKDRFIQNLLSYRNTMVLFKHRAWQITIITQKGVGDSERSVVLMPLSLSRK